MRFQVPQFIDVEDKIFGPLTIKQFIYLAGGAGLIFIVYTILPFWIAIFIMAPLLVFSLALAFYKVNNRSLIFIIESAFRYGLGSKLYIWKKQEKKKVKKTNEKEPAPAFFIPKLSDSKLKDLTWSLDISQNMGRGVGKK